MAKTRIDTKESVAQLEILISEFIKLQKSSKDTAKTFVTLQNQLNSVEGVAGKSAAGFSVLEKQLKNAKTSQKSYVTQTRNLTAEINLLTAQNKKLEAQMKSTALAANKKKKALTEMEKVSKMLKAAQERLSVVESKQYSDLIRTRKAISDKNSALRGSKVALTEQAKVTRDLTRAKAKLEATNSKEYSSLIKTRQAITKKNAALRQSSVATKQASRSYKGLIASLRGLIGAFGIMGGAYLFASIIKNVFTLSKTFDSLRFSMGKIVDTSFDLANSQRFLVRITEDYGVALVSTAQRYIKFLAAAKQVGLSLNDTEKIFRSVTKAAAVLGLKTDELSGVYLALEQMLSKGKVTTEELRRQLGERLPGAMGIMAAALNKTIPELDKMLKKGEVLSADALPKFAKALEVAFNITQVKRIDNLVAATNRLSNTWQLWVEDISQGDNGLSNFFKMAINGVNELAKALSRYTASPELKLRTMTIDKEIEAEADLRERAIAALKKDNIEIIDLSKDIQQKQYEILTASTSKRLDLIKKSAKERDLILNEELRLLVVSQTKQAELVEESEKEISKLRVGQALENYQSSKKDYEDGLKLIEEGEIKIAAAREKAMIRGRMQAATGRAKELTEKEKNDNIELAKLAVKIDKEKDMLDSRMLSLAKNEATFNTFRKKIQESNVQLPEDGDGGGSSSRVDTSEIDANIAELETKIAILDQYIKGGPIVSEQIQRTKEILEFETEIIQLELDKRIKILKKNLADEKITKKMNASEIQAANEKLNQDIIKEQNTATARIVSISEKYFKDYIKNQSTQNSIELDKLIEGIDQKEMTRKEYNAEVARITLEFHNKQLQAQIDFLKAEVIALDLQGEARVKAEQRIQELISQIRSKGFLGGLEEEAKVEETELELYQRKLRNAAEFADGINDVFNSIMAFKIEAINAEINAEENKFNKLMDLAKNDEAERESLALQKEGRLEALEKKRLKAEQKAAVANKLFAIAAIAINTAIAISKVAATKPGFLGIPEITWLKILAGLQVAAVLGAPIPQYAEGVDNLRQNERAMINDGGKKEYVERNGKILSTNTRNAIVDLKKGDTVHKDYDSLVKNSMVYSVVGGGANFSQFEFDRLSNAIEGSINKGFSNAKINNKLTINNSSRNSYLREKARY